MAKEAELFETLTPGLVGAQLFEAVYKALQTSEFQQPDSLDMGRGCDASTELLPHSAGNGDSAGCEALEMRSRTPLHVY